MTKLEQLIEELCPNGVEYVSLGTVCTIAKGVQFNKADMNDVGTYPVINGGINPSGYIEQYNQDENTITISQGGASAGYVNWLEAKFWAGAHCYVLKPKANVLNRYAYHFVKSQERKLQECQYGAGIPALAKGTVESLSIPVPPLPVQSEIVRILDNFTELTVELTVELTARKQQYAHYRDTLLKLDNNAPSYTLKDVCLSIADGDHMPPPKADSGVPFITISNITETKQIDFSNVMYVPRDYYDKIADKRKAKRDDILYTVVGSFGIPVHISSKTEFVFQRHIAILRPNQQMIVPRYMYHIMQSTEFYKQADKAAKGAAQRTIGLSSLGNMTIPLPSIEEQKRIVAILDRFDTLCNDISAGLPAEIEARQKQYEYYRDKLLTFKEKVN